MVHRITNQLSAQCDLANFREASHKIRAHGLFC